MRASLQQRYDDAFAAASASAARLGAALAFFERDLRRLAAATRALHDGQVTP